VSIPEKQTRKARRKTLSISEVADVLGLHRMSVRSAIARGEIPALRIGNRWLIPRAAIDHLLARGGLPTEQTRPADCDLGDET
jgi:excisionase family DNA binding protein